MHCIHGGWEILEWDFEDDHDDDDDRDNDHDDNDDDDHDDIEGDLVSTSLILSPAGTFVLTQRQNSLLAALDLKDDLRLTDRGYHRLRKRALHL